VASNKLTDGLEIACEAYGVTFSAKVRLFEEYVEVCFFNEKGKGVLEFTYYNGVMPEEEIYHHIHSTLYKLMWPTYTKNHNKEKAN